MIYELTPDRFSITTPLFQAMDHHLAISSIMAGLTPARIFVDEETHPTSLMAWVGHRHILAGVPDNAVFNTEIARVFEQVVIPHKLARGLRWMSLYYAPEQWSDSIEKHLLPGRNLIPSFRQYYSTNTSDNVTDCESHELPEGFELRAVDAGLLKLTHLRNLESLKEEMCSERPTVTDFLDKSFGVCIVTRDELAGWCLSEYNCADRCEIGIETGEAYRRLGLATAMTRALVDIARARGVRQVGWHCRADNRPSAATALKSGFNHVCDYPARVVGLT